MLSFNTSEEMKVRKGLKKRPAGILAAIKRDEKKYPAHLTFAALFNGAIQGRTTEKGGVFFGKAEAEWGWPHAWEQLRAAGLIEFRVDTEAGKIHWHITEKGYEVRQDDMAYFRELMAAMDADERAASTTQEQTVPPEPTGGDQTVPPSEKPK